MAPKARPGTSESPISHTVRHTFRENTSQSLEPMNGRFYVRNLSVPLCGNVVQRFLYEKPGVGGVARILGMKRLIQFKTRIHCL